MRVHTLPRFFFLGLLTSFLGCGRTDTPPLVDTLAPADSATLAALDSVRAESTRASPWNDARRRGIEFRAIGQEPGWYLEIDLGKSMFLFADYGEKKITLPAPEPRTDSSGAITFDTTAQSHHLTAVFRERVCHDSMSGEESTHEVVVTLDGSEYRGCGRRLS